MVEEDRYCIDVLTQISAIQAACSTRSRWACSTATRHCVIDGDGNEDDLTTELMAAVAGLMRRG